MTDATSTALMGLIGIYSELIKTLKNPEDDERSELVKQMVKPLDEFKKSVDEFIAKGFDINGYCNDGNILQIAIINKEYNGEILDYILSLSEIDPLYKPKDAYESMEECLYNKKNKIPQEIIDKVLAVIEQRHNEYMKEIEIFKLFLQNNVDKFGNTQLFKRTISAETKRIDDYIDTYKKLQMRRGHA
jgi:hypothetical protein